MPEQQLSTDDRYLRALASRGFWGRLRDWLNTFFFGDDIFISYARADAAVYASTLAALLTERKFICFLDQFGSLAEAEIPLPLKQTLMRSTVVVVVGSPEGAASANVRREIEMFSKTKRPIIPLDIDGALKQADWKELKGLALIPEVAERLRGGDPARQVIDLVANSFAYWRRNLWLRISLAFGFSIGLSVITLAVVVATMWARTLVTRAETRRDQAVKSEQAASEKADQAEGRALSAAEKEKQAKQAADVANDQRTKAQAKTREALSQQAVAEAAMKSAQALELEAKRRAAAAVRDEEGARATLLALEPGREFEALSLAVKAAESGNQTMPLPNQVVGGLIASVMATDYSRPLEDPPGEVNYTQISPDGTKVFGELYDRQTSSWMLWDATTGKGAVLVAHAPPQASAAFSRDGKWLVVNATGREPKLWDLRGPQAQPHQSPCLAEKGISNAALDNNGTHLLSLSGLKWDDNIRLEDMLPAQNQQQPVTGPPIITARYLRIGICEIETGATEVFEPPPKVVVEPQTVATTFNAKNEPVVFSLLEEPKAIYRSPIFYFPRTKGWRIETRAMSNTFAGFGDDGSVVMLERGRREEDPRFSEIYVLRASGDVQTLTGYKGNISSVAYFNKRARVVTLNGGKLRVSDASPQSSLAALRGHYQPLQTLVFSPDDKLILTTSNDQTARVWDASNGALLHTLYVPNPPSGPSRLRSKHATFSPDSTLLATVDETGTIQTWNTKTGRAICPAPDRRTRRDPEDRKGAEGISFLGGNDYLVMTHDFGEITFWDARTCEFLNESSTGDWFATFSHDGTSIITVGVNKDRAVQRWELKGIDLKSKEIELNSTELGEVAFDQISTYALPRGGVQVLGQVTGKALQIWRPDNKSPLMLEDSQMDFNEAVFSGDGNRVAAADGNDVRVWDTHTGKLLVVLAYHRDLKAGHSLSLSSDGSRLAVADRDHTVRIYPTSGSGFLSVADKLIRK